MVKTSMTGLQSAGDPYNTQKKTRAHGTYASRFSCRAYALLRAEQTIRAIQIGLDETAAEIECSLLAFSLLAFSRE